MKLPEIYMERVAHLLFSEGGRGNDYILRRCSIRNGSNNPREAKSIGMEKFERKFHQLPKYPT